MTLNPSSVKNENGVHSFSLQFEKVWDRDTSTGMNLKVYLVASMMKLFNLRPDTKGEASTGLAKQTQTCSSQWDAIKS